MNSFSPPSNLCCQKISMKPAGEASYWFKSIPSFFQIWLCMLQDLELGGCNAATWDNPFYGAVSDDCHFAKQKKIKAKPWGLEDWSLVTLWIISMVNLLKSISKQWLFQWLFLVGNERVWIHKKKKILGKGVLEIWNGIPGIRRSKNNKSRFM